MVTDLGDIHKILVVDDDATAHVLFNAIGRRYGLQVIVAQNCRAALATLQQAEFDVILMDWRLPDTDGMECARLIRKRQEEEGTYTPIIAVTARAMPGDREKCLEAGCDAYLAKPFKVDEFNDVVRFWARKSREFRK